MSTTLITAPTYEPVTVTEAKLHIRVTDDSEDKLIRALIKSARQQAENEVKRALVTQTWDLFLDSFPTVIRVPNPPLQSVTSIKYIDVDGAEQTLATSEYTVDTDTEPARISEAYSKTWPNIRTVQNAVTVRFVAGYGNAAAVPEAIKQWILVRVGTLYENRESIALGISVNPINFTDGLLDPYRIISFP